MNNNGWEDPNNYDTIVCDDTTNKPSYPRETRTSFSNSVYSRREYISYVCCDYNNTLKENENDNYTSNNFLKET
jgi:hypothetical protein